MKYVIVIMVRRVLTPECPRQNFYYEICDTVCAVCEEIRYKNNDNWLIRQKCNVSYKTKAARAIIILTRRMAIANGTCVSFCNQPKAHFGLPWVRPLDNRGKCYMDGKRIQCWSNASQHILIYLQQFTSYSEILV